MNWSFTIDPLLSWAWSAAILLSLALLVLAGLFLRRKGGWLRFTAFLALAAALINPVLVDEQRDPLKSVVALVVDQSQSQDIGKRSETTQRAVSGLQEQLARFNQFDVRIVEAQNADTIDERAETHLFDALESALSDVPPSRIAGSIMITDGQVHDAPSTGNGPGAPLHVLVTGHEDEFDRRIHFQSAPRFGLVNQPIDLTYRITSTNNETGPVTVHVQVNGKQVLSEQAFIAEETPLRLVVPNVGKNIVELAIETASGELTSINNHTIAIIDGIRENLRVLLVSGEPHAGERTWRNLLKSDAAVDLVHFTILRPPEKQDSTPINELSLIAFPTRELFVERIDDFDLIIFDRYQHRDVLPLLYYDYIAEYVENGGALLIAAGPEYAGPNSIARTPLIPVLPALPNGKIVEQGFYPHLTETGKRHPVTRDLEGSGTTPPEWSRWFRVIDIQDPQGDVVMKGAGERPLLVLNRYGKGRTGMLLSDQGWLWARGFEGGGPYVSLYRRVAHWLMQEPELEEERLTATGRGAMLEITRQTMSDDPGHATVISPSGQSFDVKLSLSSPGLFKGDMKANEIGLYQISNANLTTLAHIGPLNAPEFQDMVSSVDVLASAVNESGGSIRRIEDSKTGSLNLPNIVPIRASANTSGRNWIGLRTTQDSVLRSTSRIPLFAGFIGMAVLLLALGSMWRSEGR